MKIVIFQRIPLKKVKGQQLTEQEKIFANHMSDEG